MKKAFVLILIALPAIESFGWSMLAGTVGTLILAGFFSGIMSLETLSILLPIIVGANAAISGYMLIERTEDEIKRKKQWPRLLEPWWRSCHLSRSISCVSRWEIFF